MEEWKFDIILPGAGSSLKDFVRELQAKTSGQVYIYKTMEEPLAICTHTAKEAKYSGSHIEVTCEYYAKRRALHQFGRKSAYLSIKLESSSGELHQLEVINLSDNNTCPSCEAATGESAAHNIVSQSIIGNSIKESLTTFSAYSATDLFVDKIIGKANVNRVSALFRHSQNQCRSCENAQGSYSLIQRGKGAASMGQQWNTTTPDIRKEITLNHIDKVVRELERYISRGSAKYPSSDVKTKIVDAGQLGAFLASLKSRMLTNAQ